MTSSNVVILREGIFDEEWIAEYTRTVEQELKTYIY